MKRLVISFAAAAALAVAMPAAGLAKHHHSSSHHKHGKGHHARLVRYGSLRTSPMGTTGPGGGDSAGTVTTYDSSTGILTITLNDGTKVSGKVTSQTQIECQSPQGASGASGATGDDDGTEAPEQDGAQGPTTTTPTAHESDDGAQGSDDQGDDNNDQGDGSSSCGPAALTPTTGVQEAELKIGSGGAVFESVHLM